MIRGPQVRSGAIVMGHDSMSPGVERIARERRRQIEVEGFTPQHDDSHVGGQLAMAAMCYMGANVWAYPGSAPVPSAFPWDKKWWKPSSSRVRNMEIAGALCAAEIERLIRIESRPRGSADENDDPYTEGGDDEA